MYRGYRYLFWHTRTVQPTLLLHVMHRGETVLAKHGYACSRAPIHWGPRCTSTYRYVGTHFCQESLFKQLQQFSLEGDLVISITLLAESVTMLRDIDLF